MAHMGNVHVPKMEFRMQDEMEADFKTWACLLIRNQT